MQHKKILMLTFAVVLLFVVYSLFSDVYYFHPLLLAILDLAGLASALLFFFSSKEKHNDTKKKKGKLINVNLYALAIILLFFLLVSFEFVGIAVIISIIGILLLGIWTKGLSSYKLYAALAIGIILISSIAFLPLSVLRGPNWKGIDEIAFDYYAPYLLLHGINPYTASMEPILNKYDTFPTVLLNGSYEYKYDYPAMGFLPVLALPLIIPYSQLHSFQSFIAIVVLLTLFIAFIIYRKSNYSKALLLPIIIWMLASYIMIQAIDQYLAVGVFLVIAYMERKNVALSAIFLGLGASTLQLAWFALPFFYILVLREHGKKKFAQSIALSLIVFLLVNGYFLILSPKPFVSSVFGLFGTSRLVPYGANLSVLLIGSYPVALWCSAAISVITLLAFFVLFYFYTSTLKPLIAIVPAFIFFLSWRNLQFYGLAYVPLLIVVCYLDRKDYPKDLLKSKSYLFLCLALLILLSIVLIWYAHASYIKSNPLSINSASSKLQRALNGSNTYIINSINLNVSNSGNITQNLSFVFINYPPDREGFFQANALKGVMPHSYQNYELNFSANDIKGDTHVYIFGFDKNYIVTKLIAVNLTTNP